MKIHSLLCKNCCHTLITARSKLDGCGWSIPSSAGREIILPWPYYHAKPGEKTDLWGNKGQFTF